MKDIELVSCGDGTFDWNFGLSDVVTVQGNNQLRNAVIHSILLKKDELEQYLYAGKGCEAHRYVNGPGNDKHLELIRENIIFSLKQIEGVIDAKIDLSFVDSKISISNIVVVKENGEEVEINAI